MKILITLAGLDIGGAETHVAELATELHRRGHRIVIASGGGVYAEQLEKIGIKHYTVPLAKRKISHMIKSRHMLKKIIRDESPDIVHAHARIPAFIVSTLKKCCNFVFVTTVHGAFDTSFILRHLSGWGDKTLAVSDDLKKYLTDNYNVDEKNIYTSVNGISGEKFSPQTDGADIMREFNLPDNANRVCYVSRLEEGICSCAYTLIDQFDNIAEQVENLQLVIVGGGELYESLFEKARAVNNRLGREAIVLTGGRTDVNKILACAKVCVGVSRAVLEPMAMEKLCVVAGDPGYIGIVDEKNLDGAVKCNFTCRGYEKIRGEKLAEDIVRLFNMDEAEANRLRSFAGSVVRDYYSVERMVSDNEKMYFDAMRELGNDAAILGYYGFGNCGDDALLHAILNDIRRERPYFSPTVLSYKPMHTAEDYGVKSINRFNPFAIRRLFKKVRLFIAGGGSLIQDVTSTKSLFYYLYVIRLAKKIGVPIMLYGNGIGPISKPFNRSVAAKVLNMVDVITLRDPDSAEVLKSMHVTNPKIKITADPALSLEYDKNGAGEILAELGIGKNDKYFCLSVRKWKNMGKSAEAFARICNLAKEKYGLIPVIIPMQYVKDVGVSREIAKIAGDCIVVDRHLSAEELIALLSLSEGAIAVRLHMLIFGTVAGAPVLGVDYDPKVRSFSKFAELPQCISMGDLATGRCERIADSFFEHREEIKAGLEEKLPRFRELATENAKIALEMIENER